MAALLEKVDKPSLTLALVGAAFQPGEPDENRETRKTKCETRVNEAFRKLRVKGMVGGVPG